MCLSSHPPTLLWNKAQPHILDLRLDTPFFVSCFPSFHVEEVFVFTCSACLLCVCVCVCVRVCVCVFVGHSHVVCWLPDQSVLLRFLRRPSVPCQGDNSRGILCLTNAESAPRQGCCYGVTIWQAEVNHCWAHGGKLPFQSHALFVCTYLRVWPIELLVLELLTGIFHPGKVVWYNNIMGEGHPPPPPPKKKKKKKKKKLLSSCFALVKISKCTTVRIINLSRAHNVAVLRMCAVTFYTHTNW